MTDHDNRLLERLAAGDPGAFEQIFLRYYAQVHRALCGLLESREACDDLAQETFLELFRRPPRLQPGATLPAWLCRVALNKGYNSLRGERRAMQRQEQYSMPLRDDPLAEVERQEERALVREVLSRLPERQSKMLLLRHAGLSLNQIAAAVEIAPGSAGTLLARAERAFVEAYNIYRPIEPEGSPAKRNL